MNRPLRFGPTPISCSPNTVDAWVAKGKLPPREPQPDRDAFWRFCKYASARVREMGSWE